MAVIKKEDRLVKENFMMIISGQPGLGKTTLALRSPKPFLLDTDNGIDRVNAKHRCDASLVSSYEELLQDMTSDEFNNAETIVIDTGGTLIQLMKEWAKPQALTKGGSVNELKIYGIIKKEFDRLVYQIKNILKKNLIVIFHTTETMKGDTILTRLVCEGSAKDIVWTPADLGCNMFKMGKRRMLGFTPSDEYFAKGSFGINGLIEVPELEESTENDFLTRLFAQARNNLNAQYDEFFENKKTYNDAMEKGKSIIAKIKDEKTKAKALEDLKKIKHALTSRVELVSLFNTKVGELNAKDNSEPIE